MAKSKQWIALFSQTGGEIDHLVNTLLQKPDVILTNNMDPSVTDKFVAKGIKVVQMPAPQINGWLRTNEFVEEGALITAHGYLRLIPEDVIKHLEVIKKTKIYNGHPALITLYPELKGLDPQERVYEGFRAGKYHVIGSVIHEMTGEVDDGKVIMTSQDIAVQPDPGTSKEQMYKWIYYISYRAWSAFLYAELSERRGEMQCSI